MKKSLAKNTTSSVTKEAKCEEKGETTYTATFSETGFANQTKTIANIDALGHDWDKWIVDVPASEDAEGSKHRECKRPGCGEKQTASIPKTDHHHNYVKVDAKAPTCTENGNIEHWECKTDETHTGCGRLFLMKDGEYVETLLRDVTLYSRGHIYKSRIYMGS